MFKIFIKEILSVNNNWIILLLKEIFLIKCNRKLTHHNPIDS